MAGSVTDVSVRESPTQQQQQHNVNNKPQRRRLGLLRRLSSNVSNKNPKSEQKDGGRACPEQMKPPKPAALQLQRAPSFSIFGGGTPVSKLPRWTPPLSPSAKAVKLHDEENVLSAAISVDMLKRPGVPPLEAITQVRKMVGTASRAWVRDFKIRGGRSHVNAKLREMEVLETELNRQSKKSAVVPRFLCKRTNGNARTRQTAREIVEAREELMQVLLFLHLRE